MVLRWEGVTLIFEVDTFILTHYLTLRRCQNAICSVFLVFFIVALVYSPHRLRRTRIVCTSSALHSRRQLSLLLYASIP